VVGLAFRRDERVPGGILRRDFGRVYTLDAATDPGASGQLQIFVAMVTITLFILLRQRS
jgi:hypothetical protein